MNHRLYEVWREYNGSRKVWKVQFAKGICTFPCKKYAEEAVEILKRTDPRFKKEGQ